MGLLSKAARAALRSSEKRPGVWSSTSGAFAGATAPYVSDDPVEVQLGGFGAGAAVGALSRNARGLAYPAGLAAGMIVHLLNRIQQGDKPSDREIIEAVQQDGGSMREAEQLRRMRDGQ